MSRTEDMAQDRIYKHYDYYIRESIYDDDTQDLKLEIEDNLKTIEVKNSLIRNLKSEMKAKEVAQSQRFGRKAVRW